MPKLQRIKRSNGSLVYSVNIPLEIIEELGKNANTNHSKLKIKTILKRNFYIDEYDGKESIKFL